MVSKNEGGAEAQAASGAAGNGGGGGGGAAVLMGFPNKPAEEFDVALKAARLANPVVGEFHGERHVLVPQGFSVAKLAVPYSLPPRVIQGVVFDTRDSLVGYVNRFSDARTILIADYDQNAVAAYIDWHAATTADAVAQPHAVSHLAVLQYRLSEEFKRWDKMEGGLHSQADFAEFLDENAADICDPEPSQMIEISRDLEATQGVVFKSATRLESGDRSFSYQTETQVRGELRVPQSFAVHFPIYQGEEPRTLSARFRFRVTPEGLRLGFNWHRVEYQRQAEFVASAAAISEATGRPFYLGRVR